MPPFTPAITEGVCTGRRARWLSSTSIRATLVRTDGVFELLDFDRHGNVMRMRPHLTEPSHAAGNDKHRPEDAYPQRSSPALQRQRSGPGPIPAATRSGPAVAPLHRIRRCVPVGLPLLLFSFSSAANDVDDSKHHYPDPVDKVPIEREHLELSRVLTLQLPGEGKRSARSKAWSGRR